MGGGAPPAPRRARRQRGLVHDCHVQAMHRALHLHVARHTSHGGITRVAATAPLHAHAATAERAGFNLPRSGLHEGWQVTERAKLHPSMLVGGFVGVHGGGQAGRRVVMANWPTRHAMQAGEPRTARRPGAALCSARTGNGCHETRTSETETTMVSFHDCHVQVT